MKPSSLGKTFFGILDPEIPRFVDSDLPEPERGPQHHQEHQAEEARGRVRVSEPSAASPATPRQGGPSIPPGTAFQAPHCAQTGTPRCPAATTRDWPPGTMIGG